MNPRNMPEIDTSFIVDHQARFFVPSIVMKPTDPFVAAPRSCELEPDPKSATYKPVITRQGSLDVLAVAASLVGSPTLGLAEFQFGDRDAKTPDIETV